FTGKGAAIEGDGLGDPAGVFQAAFNFQGDDAGLAELIETMGDGEIAHGQGGARGGIAKIPGDAAGAGAGAATLAHDAADLGAYTGRSMTCGYLDAQRADLTATPQGRASSPASDPSRGEPCVRPLSPSPDADATETCSSSVGHAIACRSDPSPAESSAYHFQVNVEDKGIVCQCRKGTQLVEWTMPKTVVRRQNKAISIGQFLSQLSDEPVRTLRLAPATTNSPDFLLVPRAANALFDRLCSTLRQMSRAQEAYDDLIRVDLPEPVRNLITPAAPSPANDLVLGDSSDRVRLHASAVASFLKRIRATGSMSARPDALIVEGLVAANLQSIHAQCADIPLIVALPSVFFEQDITPLQQLIAACANASLPVEINNWGAWHLAKQAGVAMESGPGLPVLNALAARQLADLGIQCVTLSLEAERKQLEELTAHCPVPCSLVVFGRPSLMVTRVQLDRDRFLNRPLIDRRGVRLIATQERNLWTLRPPEPFDLRASRNERIRVRHLAMDLTTSRDPAGEWLLPPQPDHRPFRFNYNRTLA
ncbi:MAG TPA: hypothetical protein VHP11_13015, partial [Tepidisphaeraceae bacterium]|nr:hypothetical protein [Tepidisphaeraceae bacterium]